MEGQAREVVGREGAMSAPPREVPIREFGATPSSRAFDGSSSRTFDASSRTFEGSSRTFDSSRATEFSQQQPQAQGQDVWIGAIARLQTQVLYNTSMLESHRRQLSEVENAVRKLDQDMGLIVNGMNQLREEFRARPPSAQPRHEASDLDVLSRQMQSLTDKVSEVDGLKMQVDLVKSRMRRVEEQGSPVALAARTIAPPHRESPYSEPQPSQPQRAHQPSRPLQQPLPPMRTSSMSSPNESRPTLFHQPPPPMTVLQSQHSGSSYYPTTDSRHMFAEPLSGQASSASSYRPGEPLPPPSALSAWRPAESAHPPSAHPPPPPPPGPVQPRPVQHEAPSAGWATVNAHQATKRSFDEPRQSSYESSMTGGVSPKRPKLAPIMPRDAYHDDSSYVPSTTTHSTADASSYNPRNRTGSHASQTQSSVLPTPASASTPAYRFITSTAQADSQESWRPESERALYIRQHQAGGRGRGRGSRGGGRGRRGGRAGEQQQQEMGTPEWEKPDWTGSQISPNGHYQALHSYSPRQNRSELVRRGGGIVGAPPEPHEHLTPATPIVQGTQDPFAAAVGPANDPSHQTSAGKKSRTKPIRNAEGILIRKDGQPDQRSVSSANNLRKVHAKKEAERAEMEGRTPTSARSLAPAGSNSLSEEDGGEEEGQQHETTQERHQALMSRIFPQGVDEASRGVGERFFPRQEGAGEVKSEASTSEESEGREGRALEADNQRTHVDMRATSEVQAEDQRQQEDTRMSTADESRGESQQQETESRKTTGPGEGEGE